MKMQEFMEKLCQIVPVDQLPREVIFDDDESKELLGKGWMGPKGLITFRRRSDWYAEQKYKDRLAVLEARIATLELEPPARPSRPGGHEFNMYGICHCGQRTTDDPRACK